MNQEHSGEESEPQITERTETDTRMSADSVGCNCKDQKLKL